MPLPGRRRRRAKPGAGGSRVGGGGALCGRRGRCAGVGAAALVCGRRGGGALTAGVGAAALVCGRRGGGALTAGVGAAALRAAIGASGHSGVRRMWPAKMAGEGPAQVAGEGGVGRVRRRWLAAAAWSVERVCVGCVRGQGAARGNGR
jgi:hypothetical protein